MAKVILGGPVLTLVLTLLVTPVAYSLFDSVSSWFRRSREAQEGASVPEISSHRSASHTTRTEDRPSPLFSPGPGRG
jgi:hypothetical protein